MARSGESLPDLPMTAGGLDRQADRRADPQLVADALSDPATLVVELRGDRAPVTDADPARLVTRSPRPSDADRLVVWLGERADLAYVLVVTEPEDEPGPGWLTLRQAATHLDPVDAGILVTGVALANWHTAHGFCSRCGAPTAPHQGGWVRKCPVEGSLHFPRTDPAVIMTVVDDDDRVLLARGRGFTSKGMSTLAGFVEPGETLAAAVAREVFEEVGVIVDDVTYLGDQPWPFPSSLMVGFTAHARTTDLRLQDEEIEAARWFSRADLDAALAAGEVVISPRLSISRALIEHWYGGPIGGPDVTSLRPT